jgi:hypothetical protein
VPSDNTSLLGQSLVAEYQLFWYGCEIDSW